MGDHELDLLLPQDNFKIEEDEHELSKAADAVNPTASRTLPSLEEAVWNVRTARSSLVRNVSNKTRKSLKVSTKPQR